MYYSYVEIEYVATRFSPARTVLAVKLLSHLAPEFSFKLSNQVAMHNLTMLRKYQLDLGKALEVNKDLPVGPGKEFKPPNVIHKIFGLHPLWSQMEAILTHESVWPLVEGPIKNLFE
jgi:hypothetical protein